MAYYRFYGQKYMPSSLIGRLRVKCSSNQCFNKLWLKKIRWKLCQWANIYRKTYTNGKPRRKRQNKNKNHNTIMALLKRLELREHLNTGYTMYAICMLVIFLCCICDVRLVHRKLNVSTAIACWLLFPYQHTWYIIIYIFKTEKRQEKKQVEKKPVVMPRVCLFLGLRASFCVHHVFHFCSHTYAPTPPP